MPRIATIFVWLSLVGAKVCAFQRVFMSADISNRCHVGSVISGTVLYKSQCSVHHDANLQERRSFLSKLALFPLVALPSLAMAPTPTQASGGATAGGAYLLSAKKRYYERVKGSVAGLLNAIDELKKGDSKVVKAYFSGEDNGSWKDLTAAGYLLSNAFRRSSSTAPDKLPAVQVRVANEITFFLKDELSSFFYANIFNYVI